jgi:hypothetical protein
MSHQSLASNNTFLNDQCINEEIREEIFKILELNENKITTYQNLLDTADGSLGL